MHSQVGEVVAQGSGYALASAASVAMMMMVGFLVLARSPSSTVNRSFMGIIIACCLWMGGRVGIFGSLTAEEAEGWYRLSFAGLAFLPPTIYLFSNSVVGMSRRRLGSITLVFTLSTGFCLFSFVRPDMVSTIVTNVYTGWYPRHAIGGCIFIGLLAVGSLVSAAILLLSPAPQGPTQGREKRRIRLILLGLLAGHSAIFDFLPAVGFPHPPIAHFSILAGMALCGYAVGRYRVVILNPTTTAESIISSMREALFFIDLEGRILFANRSLRELLGRTDDELTGESAQSLFAPKSRLDIDLGPRGRGLPSVHDTLLRTRAGNTVHARVTVTPYFDEEGETGGYVGLAWERSEEAGLERRLQDLEREVKQVLSNSMFGVYVLSDGRLEFVNEKAAEMLDYTVDEILELGLDGLIHPDELEGVAGRVARREQGENTENHYVLRAIHKNGKTREIEIFAMSIPRGDEFVVLGFALDITDQERAGQDLQQVTEFNQWVLKNIPLGVVVLDLQGLIVHVNSRAQGLLASECSGALCGRYIRDTSLGAEPRLSALLQSEGVVDAGEIDQIKNLGVKGSDGQDLFVSVMGAPWIPGTGQGYFLVIDEAQSFASGSEAFEGDKTEWLGLLVGSIARDFEGLLGGILGYASLAKALLPGEQKVGGYLDAITQSAQKALALTGQLGSSRRDQTEQPSELDVNEIITSALKKLDGYLHPSIMVTPCLADDLPAVSGDADQLREVFFRLGLNARDAMPDGGELRVSSEELHLDNCFDRSLTDIGPGHYVCVSVSDTGPGVSEEVRDRIFDPFFTTRAQEGSAGTGLWFARSIVSNASGAVILREPSGPGATFQVYLPASPGASECTEKELETESRTGARVLVVDDEAPVREVASDLLGELGYDVFTACDGAAALEIVESAKNIEAIVLDMVMPRLNGKETFDRLQDIAPSIKVIISSGYTEDETIRNLLDRGAVGFVQKPYRVQTLVKVLNEALNSEAE